jgi:lipoate-protein ligase A
MHITVELQSKIEDVVINIRIRKTRISTATRNLSNSNSVEDQTRLDLEIKLLEEEKIQLKSKFIKLTRELVSNIENL